MVQRSRGKNMRVGAVTRIIEAWEASGCPGPHQAYAQVGQGAGQGTHSLGGKCYLVSTMVVIVITHTVVEQVYCFPQPHIFNVYY